MTQQQLEILLHNLKQAREGITNAIGRERAAVLIYEGLIPLVEGAVFGNEVEETLNNMLEEMEKGKDQWK